MNARVVRMFYYAQAVWTIYRMKRSVLCHKLAAHRASASVQYVYVFLEEYLGLACDVIRSHKSKAFQVWKNILKRLFFFVFEAGQT